MSARQAQSGGTATAGMAESRGFSLDRVLDLLGQLVFPPLRASLLGVIVVGFFTGTSSKPFFWHAIWTFLTFSKAMLEWIGRSHEKGDWLSPRFKLNWKKQTVLITGGGTGIGALLAETLAQRGATIVVLTKYPPQYKQEQERIHTYLCDVSDYKTVEQTAERVRKEVGDPTILVNNAGIVKGKLLLDLTEEDVIDTFGSNTLAHFWILKAFLPGLLKRGRGHIVTVSSVLGVIGCAQMADYCASKAALINLHECLRAELRARYALPKIQTTLVLPAHIGTSLFDQIKFPTNPLWRFLAPKLEMRDVVFAIIDALEADEGRVIRLPFYTQSARLLGTGAGLLPLWLRDMVQKIAGADRAMSEYGPHPDAAERFAAEREGRE